jgi:hypothetical protein
MYDAIGNAIPRLAKLFKDDNRCVCVVAANTMVKLAECRAFSSILQFSVTALLMYISS